MSTCAFCGKPESETGPLVRGLSAFICAGCVGQAAELLEEEKAEAPLPARPPLRLPSRVAAVIPARYGSTRFPGKPLVALAGKPMVQHVYERCLESGAFNQVVVATDDERIALAVRAFGGEVALTSERCPSGTDRVAEVARQLPHVAAFVNVQGDEPLVSPEALRLLAGAFADPAVEMATLVRPLAPEERALSHVVKAVVGKRSLALYFSRADVPFERDVGTAPVARWAHVGLYGYRRAVLLRLAGLPPTPLELTEKLEQLRALEHGIPIHCLVTQQASVGVDTPEDVARAEALLRQGG